MRYSVEATDVALIRRSMTSSINARPEEYTCKSDTGRFLRIQVIEMPEGYALTNAEEVGRGPADLSGYQGGWDLVPAKVYRTRAALEKRLSRNGWTVESSASDVQSLLRVSVSATEVRL